MIYASLLAADVFSQEAWIKKLLFDEIDGFHIDLIDPTIADFVGLDVRVIEKLAVMNIPFVVHYMAQWNDRLLEYIANHKPQKIFFHQECIKNFEMFYNLNAGVALELGERIKIDCEEYILMNVKLGYCGQMFNDSNLATSRILKDNGKIITSDGGLTIDNLHYVKHFDHIVLGSALNRHGLLDIKNAWK